MSRVIGALVLGTVIGASVTAGVWLFAAVLRFTLEDPWFAFGLGALGFAVYCAAAELRSHG